MANKVSSKTHTKQQLNNYANQKNPNNKAYKANVDNHKKQVRAIGKSKKVDYYSDLDWYQLSDPFD